MLQSRYVQALQVADCSRSEGPMTVEINICVIEFGNMHSGQAMNAERGRNFPALITSLLSCPNR